VEKMGNKKKAKKISAKKEKYAKFRKEKPSTMDVSMPDLSSDENKQKQDDELKINKFLRFSKNRPVLSLKEKRKR
jgi:hypothetical protein